MIHKRKTAVALLSLLLAFLLCGCGSGKMTFKNGDGTKTVISYKGSSGFLRLPVFDRHENYISMRFNGTEWYRACVISANAREELKDESFVAESSNVKVYKSSAEEFPYCYLIDLEGTDAAFVLIRSNDGPEMHCYGNDFGFCIEYSVGGKQTVPDTEWKCFEPETDGE